MKDIVFTAKQQKRELNILLVCFVAAILINVCSIIIYNTEWSELYSQWIWLLIITAGLYGASIGVRLLCCIVKRLIGKG